MAEAVGLASAAVGFTSLAIQLGSGATRLRAMYKQSKELRHTIRSMVEDLEFISQFLPELDKLVEENPIESPLIVGHCIQRSQELHTRIEQLEGRFLDKSSNAQLAKKAKNLLNYHRVHDDIEDLHKAILNTKTDLCMALTFTQGLQQRRFANMLLPSVNPQEADKDSCQAAEMNGPDDNHTRTSSEYTVLPTNDRAIRRKINSCQVRHCSCSCHIRGSVARRFWNLEYTPLSMILQNCDNAKCTSRRHRISLRLAFTQMGLPWAITLGLDMAVEAGKYSIGPTLETERIVRYTSPGFKLLWELKAYHISRVDAIQGFRELWRKDPNMVYHVNPAGRGYIEELVSTPTFGPALGDYLDLLDLFTREFNMRLGLDSLKLLYKSVSWIGEAPHLYLLGALLESGLDPMDLPSPHWKQWPKPCSPDWAAPEETPDPFFLEYISKLVNRAPEFGASSALHTAILAGDRSKMESLMKSPKNIEGDVNFLGQSALHIAILNDWAVEPLLNAGHDPNVRDFHGITPLMYAAGMGKVHLVKLLITYNANILLRDDTWDRTFLHYAMARRHWNTVTEAITHIEAIYQHVGSCKRLVSCLARIALVWLFASQRMYHDQSIDYFNNLLSMVDTVNFRFGVHHEATDRTLLHHAYNLDQAQALVSHGFSLFDAEDSNGDTPMMNESMLGDPDWIRMLLDAGADPNHRNKRGDTILSKFLTKLHHLNRLDAVENARIIDSITILLKNGAKILAGDQCTCPCSPNGCLPTRSLAVQFKNKWLGTENPLQSFELLLLLEECHLAKEAKETLVSFIRRSKFEGLDMMHVCCNQGDSLFERVLEPVLTGEEREAAMELNAKKLASLDEYVDQLRGLSYEDLKLAWFQQIKLSHESSVSVRRSRKRSQPKSPETQQFEIDTKNDQFIWRSNFEIDGEHEYDVESSIAMYLLGLHGCLLSMTKTGTDPYKVLVRHRRQLNLIFQLINFMEISIEDIIRELNQTDKLYWLNGKCLTNPELNDFIERLRTWAAEHNFALNVN
ncbi:hypothetical protein F5Y06DRAFT_265649 [Hypoxylon sp. FL0890]|nr:hypothetical protein F5Y06DRAFT_265649 [Hypoxylon sp. FL0890]